MTRQADFKRRVRVRMAKTGESYAAARSRLLGEHPGTPPDDSPLDWMPEALHISNGDATDVPGTGLARRVVYWRDVLHEGPVPEAELAELRQIRVAFRAATPEGLGAIAAARLGELRFLGEAFDRLGREYPATRDGLSLTERRLLAAVADGPPDAGRAVGRAWAREIRPFMGDTTCFARMDQMAQGPHPLLRLDPPGRPVARTTGVYLTGTGARVLAGQADQIALNGIDRWIGGVHLQGRHVPWRWDDGTETIVHRPGRT